MKRCIGNPGICYPYIFFIVVCCRGIKTKADDAGDAKYDVAARELAFEAKGAAGDRTLMPDEMVERERMVSADSLHAITLED